MDILLIILKYFGISPYPLQLTASLGGPDGTSLNVERITIRSAKNGKK